ncbi:MAG: lipoate--protein ligase family protein [Thermodesulfobacteriota bacterium]
MAKGEWRFLKLTFSSYARAALYMPTILNLRSQNKIPNTLAIINFEKPAVCLFYYNDPDKEIDLDFCRDHDIDVGRRDTGGSPYWMDPGTIAVILCFDQRDVADFPASLPEAYRFLIEACANSLSQKFCIPFRYRPLNDLEVNGRKISGHTLTFQGDIFRFTAGPQILRSRLDLMSQALKPLPEKFADKEAKSIGERVTSFQDVLGRPPHFEEIYAAYLDAFQERLKAVFHPGELNEEEKAMLNQREKTDFSPDWILAMREERKIGPIPAEAKRGEYTIKVPQGPLIRVIALIGGDKLLRISITGSIHCVPVKIIEDMESVLKGAIIAEDQIREIVQSYFSRPGVQIAGATAADFIKVIMGAIQKAQSAKFKS